MFTAEMMKMLLTKVPTSKQVEKQEESWRTSNIMGSKANNR